jgi:hypothetical protein
MPDIKKRAVLLSALVFVVVAGSGVVIWATVAGANSRSEPAVFAKELVLKGETVSKLAAEASHSSIRGNELKGARGKLKGKTVFLNGNASVGITSLTPAAVESSDGRFVVYSTWSVPASAASVGHKRPGGVVEYDYGEVLGIPNVRLYDADTGTDTLVEAGAYSPALSLDGRLAYVRADTNELKAGTDYTGKIVVGRVDGNSFESWTSDSAKYFPYAWAGSTLLAYRAFPDSEAADLYALKGADQTRLLAAEAELVAVSPDGTRAFVTAGRRTIEIIRVEDGSVEASLVLDGEGVADVESSTTPHGIGYSGSWYGDRVIADSDMGLIVFDVKNGIRIESIMNPRDLAWNIYDPELLDDTNLIGWTHLPRPSRQEKGSSGPPTEEYDDALVECDLTAESCAIGARTRTDLQRWVSNPSR